MSVIKITAINILTKQNTNKLSLEYYRNTLNEEYKI